MPFQVEQRADRLRALLVRDDVREAMSERCAEQGHDYENCCTMLFQVYRECKWCGERRDRLVG